MKPRLSFRPAFIRTYAIRIHDRIASKPPYRVPDPLSNNPDAATKSLPADLTFIHHPPPSAPTPFSLTTAPASPLLRPQPPPESSNAPLPPFLRPSSYNPEPPRASDEVIAKIRELRLSNPTFYSRGRLAKMFSCTENFVSKIAALKKPQRKKLVKKQAREHAEIRKEWGENKIMVRAIRQKRREFW